MVAALTMLVLTVGVVVVAALVVAALMKLVLTVGVVVVAVLMVAALTMLVLTVGVVVVRVCRLEHVRVHVHVHTSHLSKHCSVIYLVSCGCFNLFVASISLSCFSVSTFFPTATTFPE